MTAALVAIGANLSVGKMGPAEIINSAIDEFPKYFIALESISHFYQTPAFPIGTGPDYVNAAARITVSDECDGSSLLRHLHEIEALFGRKREKRWGERTLDIDLLAFGDSVSPDISTYEIWRNLTLEQQMRDIPQELILPHPRLHERAFVLVPLADVAPDWCHPVLGKTVRQMLEVLPQEEIAAIKPL